MKILVTGGCGFVGSMICRRLKQSNPSLEILCMDDFSRDGSKANRESLESIGVEIFASNISWPHSFSDIGHHDWVIHCAAKPSVLGINRDTMDTNLGGTINLLEYCKRGTGLILISSSRVYSINALTGLHLNINEDSSRFVCTKHPDGIDESFSTDGPLSLYGATKRCSEIMALEYGALYNFPVIINRCGVMAGGGQFGTESHGIFSHFIRSWKNKQAVKFIGYEGNGLQVRDCLHPDDLVPLLVHQMESHSTNRVVNVSGGMESSASLLELAGWCREKFGDNQIQRIVEDRKFDVPWLVLDNSMACDLFDWQPRIGREKIWEEIAKT